MTKTRSQLAQEIVRVSHAIHARSWVANHDGNVSVRLDGGLFMVTPTAISKADAREGALAVTDAAGKVVEGDVRPPSEFALHLGCYAERSDVTAIVHAHPPYATAMACAGKSITTFLAEAVVSIGPEVPLARFALPFGAEGAAPLAELIADHDALLLQSHGLITVGPSLELALLRMELVEHLAKIETLAQVHGGVEALPPEVLEGLIKKRRGAGLGQAAERTPLPDFTGEKAAGEGPVRSPTAPPIVAPGPTQSWKPAGPPPAADAWSGGRTEGACGIVYGASGASGESSGELKETVAAAVAQHLKGDS
jgi:L-fuculose-phosphate aldolase